MPETAIRAGRAPSDRAPLFELAGLSYSYPGARPALEQVDLEVVAGELVVVAGPSGSGKSTLLRLACGLVPHFYGGTVSGRARVAGLSLAEHGPDELAAFVGYVAQEPESQVLSSTVRGELELPLEMRGVGHAERGRAVEEAALALGVASLLERPVSALSGGELQRVALASALVLRPQLIALDEPASQLDPVAGDELLGLLRRLNEEWGTAILISEHRLERCLAAADRVVSLDAGRITFDGGPEDYCGWAVESAPGLATPGARMLAAVGARPRPSVKLARAELQRAGLTPSGAAGPGWSGGAAASSDRRGLRRRRGSALAAKRLEVRLGEARGASRALRGLDLKVDRGERIALMGRNGAGKSTLLRAAAGLIERAGGSISAPAGAALVPQSPADMFVRDRIADELPSEAGRVMLSRLGLGWALEHDPRDLSGGERQRLALALVLAGREGEDLPGLVAFDEPTRGLDREAKLGVSALVGEIAEAGAAVVVATHDVEFAASFAERVVLLGQGEVVADGDASDILSGGWYFATEVARILGVPGAITAEAGASLIAADRPPGRGSATPGGEGA